MNGVTTSAPARAEPFKRSESSSPLPPGPRWPAAAQLGAWLYQPYWFLGYLRAGYGAPFTLRFPEWPAVVTFDDPDANREIFTGGSDAFYAGRANRALRPVVGARSLLLLDGDEHLRERKLMLPPFHGARMHRYGAIMRDITARDLERWPVGRAFPVHPRTQAVTLDIILSTVFGLEEGPELERLRAALIGLIDAFSSPIVMTPWFQKDLGPRSPWGRFVRRRAHTDAILRAHIAARRHGPPGDDVLAMLLEARREDGSPMSDLELRDELMTLLTAGHETTATALAWVFHYLIEHPHVQRRVHEELDRVVGQGEVDPEGSSALAYLDAVIKETMRLTPVISSVGRELQEPERIGGIDLPAGTLVAPSIYLTHLNPRVFPDPRCFDPERFVGQKISPYAFFPFGGGVRRCIGMAFALYEMRIVLATVLRRHRVRRAPGVRVRPSRRSVTVAPSDDMPIVLEHR